MRICVLKACISPFCIFCLATILIQKKRAVDKSNFFKCYSAFFYISSKFFKLKSGQKKSKEKRKNKLQFTLKRSIIKYKES